jgi:hypothetical protein
MAKIHKSIAPQNLTQYRTWVTDTNPTSDYFQLAQVPDTLTAGKNAFLINGSENLVNTSEILIEIVDAAGHSIYCSPVAHYEEGLARIVSIEVYEDTTPGLATMTILGHLSTDKDGNVPPAEFVSRYNVKWERSIVVSPSKVNSTPVRLYDNPMVNITEVLNNRRNSAPILTYVTGSATGSLTGIPARTVINASDDRPMQYTVVADEATFKKEMENGSLTAIINGSQFSTTIVKVYNNTTADIADSYVSNSLYSQFFTTNYTMSYSASSPFVPSAQVKSYAQVDLSHLTTFSGQIYRAKVYVASTDSPAQQELLTDAIITPAEILQSSDGFSGDAVEHIGYFKDQTIPDQFWISAPMASMSLYTG